MRRPIIAANWKLHKTTAEARQFVERLYHHCPDPGEVDGPGASYGARRHARQYACHTVHPGSPGRLLGRQWAYTGEVSAPLLVDVGCAYVIIGHSSDGSISVKPMRRSAKGGSGPPLWLTLHRMWESLAQRQAGETFAVVERQIRQGLATCDTSAMAHLVFAYEPSGPLVLA